MSEQLINYLHPTNFGNCAFLPKETEFEIKCLDKGYVKLVDWVGGDATIVQAARQSTTGELKTIEEDVKLLEYLYKNFHTSPFEMVDVIFEMKMPIFIARQFVRHRTASINEYSGRYSEIPEEWYEYPVEVVEVERQLVPGRNYKVNEYYLPAQDQKNKQGSALNKVKIDYQDTLFGDWEMEGWLTTSETCFNLYKRMIANGVSREISRIHLPLSTYTKWWFKMDLHNLLHLLRLRDDSHSQYEIQVYAKAMKQLLRLVAPETMKIADKYKTERVKIEAK